MDLKKLYTPSEACTLYNIAKIRYDPTSYSLKDKLITSLDTSDLLRIHISSYTYGTEVKLAQLITNAEKRGWETLKGFAGYLKVPEPGCKEAAMCVMQDDLYIALEVLSKYVSAHYIKESLVMPTIATMCVALNSSKSCAKDMMWLAFDDTCLAPYADVHSFKLLKNELASGSQFKIPTDVTGISTTYTPSDATRISNYKIPGVGPASLYNLLLNSFEVVWALRSIPAEYKNCFVFLCNKSNVMGADFGFFREFFTLTPTDIVPSKDLEEALSKPTPEERYTAYQALVSSYGHSLYNSCVYYHDNELDKGHLLNPIFASFASFVGQISLTNIRINTVRILYEYANAKGYLKKDELPESLDPLMKAFSSFAEAPLTSTSSEAVEEEEDTATDLMTLEEKRLSGAKTGGGGHESDPMFEALDKLKSSFKSGRYSFDTSDVIDTSDAHRDAYNAIASKIELVNKLLIKRIKDIKTYNVGGKNPGIPSGRIDRKALYRYKYDPNIFYNNTYKTLESDLAFGIILDESGSMHGKGIENGRITMIVLHETLKALGINHSIIGHTSEGKYHSEITRYQAFREDKTYTTCKNYALVSTEAKSGNCDSGALYYMEKALSRVKNKDKICLIFSDGAPTECTGTDLKNQVKAMQKKGIKVIGIGINFAKIAKYYTDYANGRNLTDMLNIVAKILEEYVLKKKDAR